MLTLPLRELAPASRPIELQRAPHPAAVHTVPQGVTVRPGRYCVLVTLQSKRVALLRGTAATLDDKRQAVQLVGGPSPRHKHMRDARQRWRIANCYLAQTQPP